MRVRDLLPLTVLTALALAGCAGGLRYSEVTPAAGAPRPASPAAETGSTATAPASNAVPASVDRLVEAASAHDVEAVSAMLQLITTPCTQALGVGGPPKCWVGGRPPSSPLPEGTPVEVFPITSCEFGWYDPASARDIVRSTLASLGEVYAVLRLTAPLYSDPGPYPRATHAVVFERASRGRTPQAAVYALNASGVTLVDFPCDLEPREVLERSPLYRNAEVVRGPGS
jgi:hypothetical protein